MRHLQLQHCWGPVHPLWALHVARCLRLAPTASPAHPQTLALAAHAALAAALLGMLPAHYCKPLAVPATPGNTIPQYRSTGSSQLMQTLGGHGDASNSATHIIMSRVQCFRHAQGRGRCLGMREEATCSRWRPADGEGRAGAAARLLAVPGVEPREALL